MTLGRLCGALGDRCAPSTDGAVPLPQSSVGAAAAPLRAARQQEGALFLVLHLQTVRVRAVFEDGRH